MDGYLPSKKFRMIGRYFEKTIKTIKTRKEAASEC